jgi:hypothetical protein
MLTGYHQGKPMDTCSSSERRQDVHRKTLIEVGIRLQKYYGTAYATRYLADVNIPDAIIQRVLSTSDLRKAGPFSGTPAELHN